MPKNNKYIYGYKVLGSFSMGWEEVCFEESYAEAYKRLREYRSNDPMNRYKLSKQTRYPNPNYKPPTVEDKLEGSR